MVWDELFRVGLYLCSYEDHLRITALETGHWVGIFLAVKLSWD